MIRVTLWLRKLVIPKHLLSKGSKSARAKWRNLRYLFDIAITHHRTGQTLTNEKERYSVTGHKILHWSTNNSFHHNAPHDCALDACEKVENITIIIMAVVLGNHSPSASILNRRWCALWKQEVSSLPRSFPICHIVYVTVECIAVLLFLVPFARVRARQN